MMARWVKVKQNNGKISSNEICGGKPTNNSGVYCLLRAYFVH